MLTAANITAVEAAEDIVAQIMLSHYLGNFAVAAATQEGLKYGGHTAADARLGAQRYSLREQVERAAT